MTIEEKAYNYASKVAKNRLTASEVAAHYGRGYIESQEDMKHLGWHPVSELPKHSGTYIVIGKLSKLPFYATNDLDGKWCIKSSTSVQREFIDIDWWCYPPEEK